MKAIGVYQVRKRERAADPSLVWLSGPRPSRITQANIQPQIRTSAPSEKQRQDSLRTMQPGGFITIYSSTGAIRSSVSILSTLIGFWRGEGIQHHMPPTSLLYQAGQHDNCGRLWQVMQVLQVFGSPPLSIRVPPLDC
jgi:hypothetical protein